MDVERKRPEKNVELRQAVSVAGYRLVGLALTSAGLALLMVLDGSLARAGREDQYGVWMITAAIALVGLFCVTLYTLMKAAIQATHAYVGAGRIKSYLASQIRVSGTLTETLDLWRRFFKGTLIVEAARSIAVFVLGLLVIGIVCAIAFGAWRVVASWPTWAIVIIVLLVLNSGGKGGR